MACKVTKDVTEAAEALRQGKLVAFPTETVYGLGANAFDRQAVARVFEAKQRPHFDPLIVHVVGVEWLERVVQSVPETAQKLAERFWPGPLTFVLPKKDCVPELVTAGLPTCAVRAPDHPIAQQLLREAELPIAAPSANRFGCLSPTKAEHVLKQLGERIDVLLDGGACRVGVESTVLDLTQQPPRLLRPGGIPLEQLEAEVGPIQRTRTQAVSSESQVSPGRLAHHYAPHTPLLLVQDVREIEQLAAGKRVGLLSFVPVEPPGCCQAVEILSPQADLIEAAAGFFAALHRLDALNLDLICALPFPEHGLGLALNDRLRRAAANSNSAGSFDS